MLINNLILSIFFLKTIPIISLFFLLSGCLSFKNVAVSNDWPKYYQRINHSKSEKFINEAYLKIKAEYPYSNFQVSSFDLIRSQLKPKYKKTFFQEDFSLVEVKNSNLGEISLYIGVDASHKNYYLLLSHEVFHFINPYIKDWYMEGLATLFAEEYCSSKNLLPKNWKKILHNNENKSYLASYNLIKELKILVPNDYKRIVKYTVKQDGSDWLSINIDDWINSVEFSKRDDVLRVINKYEKILMKDTSATFSSPFMNNSIN